jgi:hypothetical protein
MATSREWGMRATAVESPPAASGTSARSRVACGAGMAALAQTFGTMDGFAHIGA